MQTSFKFQDQYHLNLSNDSFLVLLGKNINSNHKSSNLFYEDFYKSVCIVYRMKSVRHLHPPLNCLVYLNESSQIVALVTVV